jgi:hypothetical protein
MPGIFDAVSVRPRPRRALGAGQIRRALEAAALGETDFELRLELMGQSLRLKTSGDAARTDSNPPESHFWATDGGAAARTAGPD